MSTFTPAIVGCFIAGGLALVHVSLHDPDRKETVGDLPWITTQHFAAGFGIAWLAKAVAMAVIGA